MGSTAEMPSPLSVLNAEIRPMPCRCYCAILATVVLASAMATPAAAQASRLGPSVTAITAVVKGSAVAYDPRESMYLVVSAYGDLNGRFVSAAGDPIGLPFTIQVGTSGATHFPGVAYSPDANGGAGGFLVAWHRSEVVGATVYSRTVSPAGVLGPVSHLTTDGSWWEAGVDVAYSTKSQEFLVAWQAAGIRAQRVGMNGDPLGLNIFVTGTDYHRDPSVAYNPTTNEFMVVYSGADTVSAYAAARRVAAGSGTLVGTETLLNRAVGTYITEVAYNSATNRYLATWYQAGTFGRFLDAAGTPVSDVLLLATRFTAYDGLGLDYNPATNTFMMVAHDTQTLQDGAAELSGAGAIPGTGFVATDTPTVKGNYYPKVASRTDKGEWLMSTATDFARTTVQRLQSGGSGGGTPPAPPPPPCTATPATTNISIPNGGWTFALDVVAQTTTCTWTATTSAAWLQFGAGASRTGSASVAVTATNNWSLLARSATVSVGSNVVTISQAGYSPAAVHDMTGDGFSDLVWQNASSGEVALWGLRANSVVLTASLPSVANPAWKIVGTGDLNGDSYSDLIWQTAAGDVAAWFMRGSTLLTGGLLNYANVGPHWKIRAVGDVNGDGKSDIIWQHDTEGWLAVWLMNGLNATSTQLLSVNRMPDPHWVIAGAGDINGDGKADIVWQNQATGEIAAWLMDGAQAYAQQSFSIPQRADLNWKIRGVGDVNGDGRADLVWQNTATGGIGVWFLNWFTVVSQDNLFFTSGVAIVPDTNWQIVGPG
jgi:hypothetical protein